jgi:hypothetical protein
MITACLIGNGASVAYSDQLTVEHLTADLLHLFNEAGANNSERALAAFAETQSHIAGDQFEALLGPLSSTAEALGYLPGLSALAQAAGASEVVSALRTAADFLADIHRVGLAITLHHIASRSIGSGQYDDIVQRTAQELVGLGPADTLSVATLNYDGLLHAGMLDVGRNESGGVTFEVVDLAAGYVEETKEVVPGHAIVGHPLRNVDDLMSDRAALLQLHGSLGWLSDPAETDSIWRFELDDLRFIDYWNALRKGETQWRPVVVLTDRKERAVSKLPFSLAYEIFQRRLITSERWLIVGYRLGDVPVNTLFSTAIHERERLGLGAPPTLVIGLSSHPNVLRARTAAELRIPIASLSVCGLGLPDAFDSPEWMAWKVQ